jgi:membrane protease YdiL (CAAX protease family)
MDTAADKQPTWRSRDAWFCVLALVVSQFVIGIWMHLGARSDAAFSDWLRTASGSAFTVLVQGGVWLLCALWFSRVQTIRDFTGPAGLKQRANLFGWCAGWLAISIAFIGVFGDSKGWGGSGKQPPLVGYNAPGMAGLYFTLKSVLIVPLYEEAVTRGFLYRAFRGSYGPLVTSSLIVCFSAYFHWRTVSLSLFSFGCLASLWVLLCVVREETGSLWNCLLCHAVYNAVGLHLWFQVVIVMVLFLPFVARRTGSQQHGECPP